MLLIARKTIPILFDVKTKIYERKREILSPSSICVIKNDFLVLRKKAKLSNWKQNMRKVFFSQGRAGIFRHALKVKKVPYQAGFVHSHSSVS